MDMQVQFSFKLGNLTVKTGKITAAPSIQRQLKWRVTGWYLQEAYLSAVGGTEAAVTGCAGLAATMFRHVLS